MINALKYVRAKSLEEAYVLNQNRANKVVGGMMWLRLQRNNINTLIDLCDLGLNKIEESDLEYRIGAMVSLRQLETHQSLNEYTDNAIYDSLKSIVGTQFRNMATIGGSIYSRFGFSDVLTVLLALDSYVELYKGGIIPLSKYVNMAYDRDILVSIIIKKTPVKIVYQSLRNTKTDLPVICLALAKLDGKYQVSVGSRPQKAMLIQDDKSLLEILSEESIINFSDYVSELTPVESNLRGSSKYRKHLIKVLVQRSFEKGGLDSWK